MMPLLRVLSLAAASGRVGMTFMVRDELIIWEVSRVAAQSPEDAAQAVANWIHDVRPTVVIVERCTDSCRKSPRTRAIIDSLAIAARRAGIITLPVIRTREYKNKYDEAAAYAKLYPELLSRVPTRKFTDPEPDDTVLFEALVLAHAAHSAGAVDLATAMD